MQGPRGKLGAEWSGPFKSDNTREEAVLEFCGRYFHASSA